VGHQEQRLRVLVSRQELTGADRAWAAQYESGDIVRYGRGSKTMGIEAGEYATVREVDADQSLLTVDKADGKGLTYDPRRLHSVTVYKEDMRAFSEGDRVQFTAPFSEKRIANRELGTVERVDSDGNLKLRLDSGREIEFAIREHPHLDYGYAVTSHSSQGLTADRVLVHVDTEAAHENLVNTRLAYVSISRARDDAHIFTNDAERLIDGFSREVSKASALELEPTRAADRSEEHANEEQHARGSAGPQAELEQAHGHSIGS
jgi:ATP-dependent exoDNAse (exonuclease V) alpha subunit